MVAKNLAKLVSNNRFFQCLLRECTCKPTKPVLSRWIKLQSTQRKQAGWISSCTETSGTLTSAFLSLTSSSRRGTLPPSFPIVSSHSKKCGMIVQTDWSTSVPSQKVKGQVRDQFIWGLQRQPDLSFPNWTQCFFVARLEEVPIFSFSRRVHQFLSISHFLLHLFVPPLP